MFNQIDETKIWNKPSPVFNHSVHEFPKESNINRSQAQQRIQQIKKKYTLIGIKQDSSYENKKQWNTNDNNESKSNNNKSLLNKYEVNTQQSYKNQTYQQYLPKNNNYNHIKNKQIYPSFPQKQLLTNRYNLDQNKLQNQKSIKFQVENNIGQSKQNSNNQYNSKVRNKKNYEQNYNLIMDYNNHNSNNNNNKFQFNYDQNRVKSSHNNKQLYSEIYRNLESKKSFLQSGNNNEIKQKSFSQINSINNRNIVSKTEKNSFENISNKAIIKEDNKLKYDEDKLYAKYSKRQPCLSNENIEQNKRIINNEIYQRKESIIGKQIYGRPEKIEHEKQVRNRFQQIRKQYFHRNNNNNMNKSLIEIKQKYDGQRNINKNEENNIITKINKNHIYQENYNNNNNNNYNHNNYNYNHNNNNNKKSTIDEQISNIENKIKQFQKNKQEMKISFKPYDKYNNQQEIDKNRINYNNNDYRTTNISKRQSKQPSLQKIHHSTNIQNFKPIYSKTTLPFNYQNKLSNFKLKLIPIQNDNNNYKYIQNNNKFNTVQILVQVFCQQVKLDQELRNAKMWFKSYQQNNKWKNIYMEQRILKEQFQIKQIQHNPFFTLTDHCYNIQSLINAYQLAQKHWHERIAGQFTREKLKENNFNSGRIDLVKKGTITTEDIVRFLNIQSGTFYRNRDISIIIKRMKINNDNFNFEQLLTILCNLK